MRYPIAVILLVIQAAACSITPDGKKKSSEGANGPSDIRLDYVTLNRPFKSQEFNVRSFYLDGSSLQNNQLRLLGPDGLVWSVAPDAIDEVAFFDIGLEFAAQNSIWVTQGNYMWRVELNDVFRTVEPIDPSGKLDLEKELAAYEVNAAVEELDKDGYLMAIGVTDDRILTRDGSQIYEYLVDPKVGLVRQKLRPPPGAEDWSGVDVRAFGPCTEQCFWLLAKDKIFINFPQTNLSLSESDWIPYTVIQSFDGTTWESVVSVAMKVSALPNEKPQIDLPVFMTSRDGIFITKPTFELVFTSRTYDPAASYTFKNVLDISRDFCLNCHTGFLGLDAETTWRERKDVILKYILPSEKESTYTMPTKDSFEFKHMTDDERNILAAWLRSIDADESRVNIDDGNNSGGLTRFKLSDELMAAIDGGYGRCLNCHNSGADDMRLKSWWLNPVRANRSGMNGKEAAIASLRTTAAWKMPIGATLSATQINDLEALLQAVKLD